MDPKLLTPELIQRYMNQHELTARALSRKVGVNQGTASRWLMDRDKKGSRRPTGLAAERLFELIYPRYGLSRTVERLLVEGSLDISDWSATERQRYEERREAMGDLIYRQIVAAHELLQEWE